MVWNRTIPMPLKYRYIHNIIYIRANLMESWNVGVESHKINSPINGIGAIAASTNSYTLSSSLYVK